MSRRRRFLPRPAAEGLDAVLDDLVPEDGGDLSLLRLQRAWTAAVGPVIAAESRPVALVDGVVHVACEDATWAHEIQLLEARVVARIREAGFDDVRAIRTRAGG